MLTNLFLAILLIIITIGTIISLDMSMSIVTRVTKKILRLSHRSKLLTEYILRAYIRYRKTINKPLINNSY